MLIDENEFSKVSERIGYIPFEQSSTWRSFKKNKNVSFLFFTDNLNDPCIACWGRILKKPGIGHILDIIGEIKKESISQKQITDFFQSIIADAKCNIITYNSISLYECMYEIGLRRSGFIKPLGFKTCPLTILVNIKENRKADRNWRRNIKKAIEQKLVFEVVETPSMADALIVSNMFQELKAMKSLGYGLNPNELNELLNDKHFTLFYVKKDNKPICARIVYINNRWAADVFAANSFESRKYSATNYIMEEIFNYLKEKEVEIFDFSRIPPSANETDSVYIFKNSAGGYPMQYVGEWIWCRKKLFSLLFCIYNFYMRKSHQY